MNPETLVIRASRHEDRVEIAAIIRAAFAATAVGYHGEAELVDALGDDDAILLSLVAESGGKLVGHALFTQMTVAADGAAWRAAALGPVAVYPAAQSGGLGSALIRSGLDQLALAGVQASFVLGHPGYYPRFGFRAEVAAPFASPYAGPHFMALLLDKSLQIPKSGRAEYAAAFSR